MALYVLFLEYYFSLPVQGLHYVQYETYLSQLVFRGKQGLGQVLVYMKITACMVHWHACPHTGVVSAFLILYD